MLTVLGGLAEFERELIRARTSEGRDPCHGAWREIGAQPKLTPHQKKEAIDAAMRASRRARLRVCSMSRTARFRGFPYDIYNVNN